MQALEGKNYHYLIKLKKSIKVKQLIKKHHGQDEWQYFNEAWEAKEDRLQLQG